MRVLSATRPCRLYDNQGSGRKQVIWTLPATPINQEDTRLPGKGLHTLADSRGDPAAGGADGYPGEDGTGLRRPTSKAYRVKSARLRRPSLSTMCARWVSMVLTLRHNWVPTSLLVYPWARSLSTSCSRELRSLTGACGDNSVRVGWS